MKQVGFALLLFVVYLAPGAIILSGLFGLSIFFVDHDSAAGLCCCQQREGAWIQSVDVPGAPIGTVHYWTKPGEWLPCTTTANMRWVWTEDGVEKTVSVWNEEHTGWTLYGAEGRVLRQVYQGVFKGYPLESEITETPPWRFPLLLAPREVHAVLERATARVEKFAARGRFELPDWWEEPR